MTTILDSAVFQVKTEGAQQAQLDMRQFAEAFERANAKLLAGLDERRQAEKAEDRAREAEHNAEKQRMQEEAAAAEKAAKAEQERLDRVARARENAGAGIRKLDAIFTAAARTGAVALTAALGGTAFALQNLVGHADELRTLSSVLGLPAQRIQELDYAATASGSGLDKVSDALREMATNLRESAMAGGKGSAADALRQLGVNFKDFVALSPDRQLLALADAYKAAGTSAGSNAALMRIFGEDSGPKMARLLGQGSEGIKELSARAHELGVVMGGDTLRQADAVAKSWRELTATGKGLLNTVVAPLLPIVDRLVKRLTAWAGSNRELIASRVEKWAASFGAAIASAEETAKRWLPVLRQILDVLVDWGPALLQVGVAIKAGIIGAEVIAGLQAFTLGLKGAASATAFLAGPGGIGLLVGALTVAIPLALKLGDALGDIGSQESGRRATLSERLNRSEVGRTGQLAGAETLTQEVAALSQKERDQLKAAAIANLNAASTRGDTAGVQRGAGIMAVIENANRLAPELELQRAIEADVKARAKEHTELLEKLDFLSKKEVDQLLKSGQISKQDAQNSRAYVDARNNARFQTGSAKGGGGADTVSDDELAKLINAASASGADLDSLLKGRKIAGNTPPVITVQVHNYNVQVDAAINVKSTADARGVAQETLVAFKANLGELIRDELPRKAIAR